MALTFDDAIGQLGDRSSAKRRAAAKRLRTLGNSAAGPALLDALCAEVADPRTWETQYQMIMALGACRHSPSVDLLKKLASQQDGYTMVGVALGDALVRIEWATSQTLTVIDRYMPNGSLGVIDGTFRATAMLQLTPPYNLIDRIIAFATGLSINDPLRCWVAAAAASWEGPNVEAFLQSCVSSQRPELSDLAEASLAGTHIKHRPL